MWKGQHLQAETIFHPWADTWLHAHLQGVHAVFDGTPGKPWKEGEHHRSRMVFIGRDLDERILREGFSKCLV